MTDVQTKPKHDNLKEMLDSNKDSLKLEAMKRIIVMISRGKDASKLFPSVVKNVVSKNIEIKKLVYMYVIRYAENQQDLVLLSISTFQRSLKEPNQLIRANALKVLSSIKVKMIIPIVLLAIKDAVVDLSAYVRKTATFAISKLYELDPERKPELVSYIDKLLNDRTTSVIGPAVMVFQKICPERNDLIHKTYKKLCNFIADVDEWSQVLIINLLTEYIRRRFPDPNTSNPHPDHKLLLKSVKPLLQSRNSSVVISVVQLYHHTGQELEFISVIKPLIRLLRSCPEIQIIVLDIITSVMLERRKYFEPYIKSFFVRRSDVIRVKVLKLGILTGLSDDKNVSSILKEMRSYLESVDEDFVVATIGAIGKCACRVGDVVDLCLTWLLSLLSSKNERVVSRSVVVIKDLIGRKTNEPYGIIERLTRIFDRIVNPEARATVLWLLSEHREGLGRISPDVLRKLAKNFCDESIQVKHQALNLAFKLKVADENDRIKLLCEYIFNVAKYDRSYDVRDKVRFLKYFYQNGNGFLRGNKNEIFFGKKHFVPVVSGANDKTRFRLGTLSHYLNSNVAGHRALPPFSEPNEILTNGLKKSIFIEITDVSSDDTSSSSSRDYESDDESFSMETPRVERLVDDDETFWMDQKNDFDLLDLDNDISDTIPILTPSHSGFVSPKTTHRSQTNETHPLLDKINGNGLSITYKYSRFSHAYPRKTANISLTFTNHNVQDVTDIKIESKSNRIESIPIKKLSPNCSLVGILGVDFNDTTRPVKITIASSLGESTVRITPPVGELIRPVSLPEDKFQKEQLKLRGMNEHSITIATDKTIDVTQEVSKVVNVNAIFNSFDDVYWFAGETLSSSSLVLISIIKNDAYKLTVNSEKIIVGSLLINDLKNIFQ